MKRKIAILMAIVLVVTALCCACGKDPGETQTSDTTTTTVPQETLKANEIFEKLKIVMEVNKTIVENPVYSIVGSDIGQIEFTCNGSNFVFRGAQSIDYSDIHGITAPVNVNEMRMLEKGGTKYIYITLMDGGRIPRQRICNELHTLYTFRSFGRRASERYRHCHKELKSVTFKGKDEFKKTEEFI